MTTARAFDPGDVPPADDPLADAAQMDPEPFVGEMPAARPYPLDALPEPMRAAVLEYAAFGQQPMAMIATSALSALSLAAQHLADVARGQELIGPTSLNTLTVAISGERKTSADRALTSGCASSRRPDAPVGPRRRQAQGRHGISGFTGTSSSPR